jgi:hypothetical protein
VARSALEKPYLLDCGTEGGLKTILDRIAALELRLPPATGSQTGA